MSDLVKVSGLWPNKSGKGWGGKLRDAVTIPAGARVMLFDNRGRDNQRDGDPEFSLVYGLPDDSQQRQEATNWSQGTQPPPDHVLQRGQRQPGGMSQRAERPPEDLDDSIPF